MTTCEKCGGTLLEDGDRPSCDTLLPTGHKPGCPDGIACAHDALRRSCEICERDARIAELESTERETRATFKTAHDLLDGAGVYCADGTHPQLLGRMAMLIDRGKERIADLERQLAEANSHEKLWRETVEKQEGALVEEQRLSALKLKSLAEALAEARQEVLEYKNLLETTEVHAGKFKSRAERLFSILQELRPICLDSSAATTIIDAALRGETGQ